ncbi:MAG: hypothetical protein N2C12_12180 [Planctomycetales bacterium]
MVKVAVSLLTLLALLAAEAAEPQSASQQSAARRSATGPGPMTDSPAVFQALDLDGDGLVRENEVPTEHIRLFQRLLRIADSDRDGALDLQEMEEGLRPSRPHRPLENLPPATLPAEEPAAVFVQMDVDKDGLLTGKELPAAGRQMWQRFLEKADRNSSGDLNIGEFMGNYYRIAEFLRADAGQMSDFSVALFEKLDRNGDGELKPGEVPKGRRKQFKRLIWDADDNDNGSLDLEEFSAGVKQAQQAMSGAAPMQAVPDSGSGDGDLKDSNADTDLPDRVAEIVRRAMRMDTNDDGVVSQEEAKGPIRNNFEHVDADQNSKLNRHEITIAAQFIVQKRKANSKKAE